MTRWFNNKRTDLWVHWEWVHDVPWTPWCRATCSEVRRDSGTESQDRGDRWHTEGLHLAFHLTESIRCSKHTQNPSDSSMNSIHSDTTHPPIARSVPESKKHAQCCRRFPQLRWTLNQSRIDPPIRRTLVEMQTGQCRGLMPCWIVAFERSTGRSALFINHKVYMVYGGCGGCSRCDVTALC